MATEFQFEQQNEDIDRYLSKKVPSKSILGRLKRTQKEEVRNCVQCHKEFTVANRRPRRGEIVRKSYSKTCSPSCSRLFLQSSKKEYSAFERARIRSKNNG